MSESFEQVKASSKVGHRGGAGHTYYKPYVTFMKRPPDAHTYITYISIRRHMHGGLAGQPCV